MFLDWKNQYCQNDYATQSNQQIQCNSYKITNGIFHRTRMKNLKICVETQKTPYSQNNLEKEKRNRLLIQNSVNESQITKIHRIRTKIFTIHTEPQKIPNSQSSLEKEEQSWRNHPS